MSPDTFKKIMAGLLIPVVALGVALFGHKKTRRELQPGASEDQSLSQAVALHFAQKMQMGQINPKLLDLTQYSIYTHRTLISRKADSRSIANQRVRIWIIDKKTEEETSILLASGFQATYGGPVRLDEDKLRQLMNGHKSEGYQNDSAARLLRALTS